MHRFTVTIVILSTVELTGKIKCIEGVIFGIQLRRQDPSGSALAIHVAALLDDNAEVISGMEIGKKVDIGLKNLCQFQDLLRRKSCCDAGSVKAAVDRAAH